MSYENQDLWVLFEMLIKLQSICNDWWILIRNRENLAYIPISLFNLIRHSIPSHKGYHNPELFIRNVLVSLLFSGRPLPSSTLGSQDSTLMNTLMLSHDMWNRVVHSTGDIHSGRMLLMGLNEVQDYRAPRFEFFNLTGCLLFTGVRLTEDWLSYYISPVYIHSSSLFVCSDL
ncbi:hypothetical protein BDB01DRAFT_834916 [Pilobolus umbonatus]|nr:hypothetical protein BDB01DRAFT_834916 [Pilobolus umbonatus]